MKKEFVIFIIGFSFFISGCVSNEVIPESNAYTSSIDYAKDLVDVTTGKNLDRIIQKFDEGQYVEMGDFNVYRNSWCPKHSSINNHIDVYDEMEKYCLSKGGELKFKGVCTESSDVDIVKFTFMVHSWPKCSNVSGVDLLITEPKSYPHSDEYINKLRKSLGYKTSLELKNEKIAYEKRHKALEKFRKQEKETAEKERKRRKAILEKARSMSVARGDSICTENNYLGSIEDYNSQNGRFKVHLHHKSSAYLEDWYLVTVVAESDRRVSTIVIDQTVWLGKSSFVKCDVDPIY